MEGYVNGYRENIGIAKKYANCFSYKNNINGRFYIEWRQLKLTKRTVNICTNGQVININRTSQISSHTKDNI